MPEIDNLSIHIKADANRANEAISRLLSNVRQLGQALSGAFTASTKFGQIGEGFQKINVLSKETTSNLTKASETYQKSLENAISSRMAELKTIQAKITDGLNMGIDDTKINSMRDKLQGLQEQVKGFAWELERVRTETAELNATRLSNFEADLQKLEVPPVMESNMERLKRNLEALRQKAAELRAAFQNAMNMGKVKPNVDDKGFTSLRKQIVLTEKRIEALKSRIAEVRPSPLLKLGAAMKEIGAASGKASSKLASMIAPLKKLTSAGKGLGKSFAGGFKNILKYALGISGLSALFNKLSSAFKEGLQSLVQYSDETNASVSMLKNSLTQLKNSVAAAVSPLLNALAPALDFIIQLCVKAVNAINQLISASLGKGTWIHAKKLTDSYKDSLSGVSKAAEKLQKGVRAFDELNLITTPDDKDGGSGTGTAATDMFETLPIESKFADLADKISGFFANAWKTMKPFRDALTDLWENGLTKFGNFTWTALKDFYENFLVPIGKWAFGTEDAGLTRLVNIINDGLMKINWEALNTSLKNFWIAIEPYAEQFGEGLIDFFEDIKNLAVDSINKFPDFLDRITGALNNGDPETARKWGYAFGVIATGLIAFKNAVAGIEIAVKIFKTLSPLFSGISSAVSGLGGLLGGLSAPVLTTVAAFAALAAGLAHVFATNEDVRNSFFEAVGTIRDALTPAIEYVTQTVLPDLKNGWERVLEILSPLGEFLENTFTSIWQDMINPALKTIGEDVLPKLTDTFKNLWENVLVPLGNLIADILEPVFRILADTLDKMWKNVVVPLANAVGSVLKAAFDGLVATINHVINDRLPPLIKVFQFLWKNVLEPIASYLWSGLKPVFETVFTFIGNLISSLGEMFSGLIQFISGVFSADWAMAWEGIKNIFHGVWNGIASILEAGINLVIDGINWLTSGIRSSISTIASKVGIDFEIGEIPKVSLPMFASGGYIENPHSYSLLMAGENGIPEIIGTVGGKSAVAGGQEITGISDTVRTEAERDREMMREEINLLKSVVKAIYETETSSSQVFQMVRQETDDYFTRNGKSPFLY